ncbi:MAG: ZIP family metal transporter [Thermoanaerobacteraceae bacterium]|nr:ZIP family metal transporter [Thermoanaerobacteraceae bacterium]
MYILVLSLLAGLATTFGGLMVVARPRWSERSLAVLLGGAGGIMGGVVLFDLLPSAWRLGGVLATAEGFCTGVIFLFCLDRLFSFFMPASPQERNKFYMINMGYLIAVGIALHDLPEGIAITAGYAVAHHLGLVLVIAIALHNIPEGMATAVPLLMGGLSSRKIVAINGLVSLFTPAGALLGMMLLKISPGLIALLLAVAAGAMVYIVRFELIPESRTRHPNYSLLGIFVGFNISILLTMWH